MSFLSDKCGWIIGNKGSKLLLMERTTGGWLLSPTPPMGCGQSCGFVIEGKNCRVMLTSMPGQTGSLGDDKFQDRGMLIDTQVPRLDNCDKTATEQHVCWHNNRG